MPGESLQMQQFDNFTRQWQRETQSKDHAISNIHRQIRQSNEKTYASSNIIGQTAIRTYLSLVNKEIEERLFVLRRGKAAVDAETVFQKLKEADPDPLSLITMKVALDVLGKEANPQLQELTVPIGAAIHTQLRMDYFHDKNPNLYQQVEQFFHGSTGTRQKATVLTRAFNQEGIEFPAWDRHTRHKVGAWLLDCLIRVTGWLKTETVRTNNGRKTRTVMRYTDEFIKMREQILNQAEHLAFCQWPMLCPPIDWGVDGEPGGYLSEVVRGQNQLVRRTKPLVGRIQGTVPVKMLNNLQQVAYRINPVVMQVAEHCYEHQITIGKFVRERHLQRPPSPGEQATEEQILNYKHACRDIENHNAQIGRRNCRTTDLMYVARLYKEEPAFFHAWNFCYRGRVYPLTTALSVQGTDVDRALHYFSAEGVIDEWYLAFHVSNTFGNDKLPIDERIQWTRDNLDHITQIALDPIGTIPLWENVSEPWSHMAACHEYYVCCIAQTKWSSGLPVGIDATQSGIQHLAALTKCADAGTKVNLYPKKRPADGYRSVAEYAARILPHPYNSWMNRRITKRPTMCTPYGLQKSSCRDYVRTALLAEDRNLKEPGVLSQIVNAVFDEAIPAIFPGPVDAMHWIQSCAKHILTTKDEITWTSSSGFKVVQDLRVPKGRIIKTRLMGHGRVECWVGDGMADPDKNHHKNALAPNFIHSQDSALVHLTFCEWDRPFTLIHDCALGRSCDMADMSRAIRRHFVDMYDDDVLQGWADEVGVEIPEGLIKNTLDIHKVLESDYFFC